MSLYEGIKESYPKLPEKVSAYIQLSRPYTIVIPTLVAFFIIGIERLYNGHTLLSSWEWIYYSVLSGLSVSLLHIAGQVSNQICDGTEYDEACGKGYRPLCQGIISKWDAWTVVFMSTIVSLNLAFYIKTVYGFLLTILLFFAIFNNLEPIRAKKRYMVNEIWLGLSRGFLPPVAFWAVLDGFGIESFLIGLVGFFYVFSTNWVKDVTDYEGDEKFGVDTLVVHNDGNLSRIASIMYPNVLVMVILVGLLANYYSLAFVGLIVFPVVAMYILYRMDKSRISKTNKMENTKEWVLFYLGLIIGYGITFLIFRVEAFFSLLS